MSSDTLYRTMATLLAVVVMPYLALVTAAWLFQRHLIYLPSHDVPAPAEVGLGQAEPVSFRTTDGVALAGWLIPAVDSSSGYTAIVFNGNAGHRAYRAPLAAALARHGITTLLFDYRGYGGNAGLTHRSGARARRARGARLRAQPQRPSTRIASSTSANRSAVRWPRAWRSTGRPAR